MVPASGLSQLKLKLYVYTYLNINSTVRWGRAPTLSGVHLVLGLRRAELDLVGFSKMVEGE